MLNSPLNALGEVNLNFRISYDQTDCHQRQNEADFTVEASFQARALLEDQTAATPEYTIKAR